jgi:hypothetical protein
VKVESDADESEEESEDEDEDEDELETGTGENEELADVMSEDDADNENDFARLNIKIPKSEGKIEEAIKSTVLGQPYNLIAVAKLVNLAQGRKLTPEMNRRSAVFLIGKMSAFSYLNLVPGVLKRINSSNLLDSSISTSDDAAIIPGLGKARSSKEWAVVLKNFASYRLHKAVEKSSAEEMGALLSTDEKDVKSSHTLASISKNKAYIDLAREQFGERWKTFTEEEKVSFPPDPSSVTHYLTLCRTSI